MVYGGLEPLFVGECVFLFVYEIGFHGAKLHVPHSSSLPIILPAQFAKGGMKRRLRVSMATAMSDGRWYIDSLHVFFHGFWGASG